MDIVFISIAIFLIVFAWLQFFLKNILLSLFASIFVSIGIMLLLRLIFNKKHSLAQNALLKQDNMVKFKLAIQTMSNTKLTQLIKKLIPKHYLPISKNGDIVFTKNGHTHLITFCFSTELSDGKVLDLIKTKKSSNLIIVCGSVLPSIKSIIKAFVDTKITIITLDDLYEICEENNVVVDTSNINLNKPKLTFKNLLKNSISREKSKGYFISGLVLLFTSIIIPYSVYYVVFSTALLTLSLICRLQPKTQHKHNVFD